MNQAQGYDGQKSSEFSRLYQCRRKPCQSFLEEPMTSFNLTEFYERADRKDKEVQRKILALPGARRDLDTLVKAGANEKEVLKLLSFTVIDRGAWRKPMRGKKRNS